MDEERRSSGGPPPRGDDSGPRRSEGRSDRSDRPERSDRFDRGDQGDRGDRGDRFSDRGDRGGGDRGGRRPQRRRFVRRFHRRKVCRFCVAKTEYIDYKDARHLKRYVSDRGKIMPRRMSGCCARHQRMLTTAVKRARNLAILPYKAQ